MSCVRLRTQRASIPSHALAQAVIRRLHTAAARVQSPVTSCGICGNKVVLGLISNQYFSFYCNYHSTKRPFLTFIILGWYKRPIYNATSKGLSLIAPWTIQKVSIPANENLCDFLQRSEVNSSHKYTDIINKPTETEHQQVWLTLFAYSSVWILLCTTSKHTTPWWHKTFTAR
jgi:hypothetical protein